MIGLMIIFIFHFFLASLLFSRLFCFFSPLLSPLLRIYFGGRSTNGREIFPPQCDHTHQQTFSASNHLIHESWNDEQWTSKRDNVPRHYRYRVGMYRYLLLRLVIVSFAAFTRSLSLHVCMYRDTFARHKMRNEHTTPNERARIYYFHRAIESIARAHAGIEGAGTTQRVV